MPGKNKFFFIILLIASLLLISGCSECKKSTDCEAKSCFTTKCVDKKCVYNANENCCGNEICEDGTVGKDLGENKGNCQKDCGACSGEEGKYLSVVYDNKTKDCATSLDESKVLEDSVTDTMNLKVFKLTATYSYEKPFNVDKARLNAYIKLDSKDDTVSNVKITQIKVLEVAGKGSDTTIFGETEVNKILWDTSSTVDKDIVLNVPVGEETEVEKSITIEMYYEVTKEYRGKDVVEKGSYKTKVSKPITFVDPGLSRECPASCDDYNKCTDDSCGEQTDYFCVNNVKAEPCCGNNVCDGLENECVCKEDCGECEKDYGTYITFACSENMCKSMLKDQEVIKPKTLVEQPNLRAFQFEVKTRFDDPFDTRTSKVTIDVELISMDETTLNIKCTKYQVLVRDVLLGETIVTNSFNSRGSVANFDIILDFSMADLEEKKSPELKGSCEYDKLIDEETQETQHLITSFSQSLGDIVFVKTEI
jgi:hypothetical protein